MAESEIINAVKGLKRIVNDTTVLNKAQIRELCKGILNGSRKQIQSALESIAFVIDRDELLVAEQIRLSDIVDLLEQCDILINTFLK